MTYAAFDQSVESGRPVELYEFRISNEQIFYTSAEDDLVVAATSYLSRQIARTQVNDGRDIRKQEVKITLPSSDLLASRYIQQVPDLTMTISILRAHRDDPDEERRLLFKGRVTAAGFSKDGVSCTLSCRGLESGLGRNVPRFGYQGLCNHVLYDGNCKIDRELNKYEGTVLGVNGNKITVQGVSTEGADWAEGGYVQIGPSPGEAFRLVLAQSGDELTLLLPFENDPSGTTVTVFAGCKHDITTCENKFNNVINFGGFPFVPTLNPFTDGLDV